jgi:signal transduction histidine kinase
MAIEQNMRDFAPTYEQLAALFAALQSIGPTLDLEEALNQIVQAAVGLVEAERGFILWEPQSGATIRACANLTPGTIDESALELARRVAQAKTGEASDSHIAMPLWSPEEAACALYVKGAFSAADAKLLEAFAQHAAVAIQNAWAFCQAGTAEAEFASMIAHDLRLPTTNVRGYSDLLLKEMVGPLSEQQRAFLSIIHANTYYMETLTYNLSDIAKIDHHRMPLKPMQVSLEASVNAVLDKLRSKIDEKAQTLELDLPALPDIFADKARLDQVLRILLENAHLYTPSGGKITVAAEQQGALVRLTVADTGIGISPADRQDRLFTKFFRADHPVVQEHKGGGNNLYVAKRLVELMGGEMGAESEPDKGSTFWFTVPVATPDE